MSPSTAPLMMETMEEEELCFPHLLNTSCRRPRRPPSETLLLYVLLSCISVLTVLLNLFVIISISHYRKLHTPTNLLLLSLAASDLLVGLVVMPSAMVYMQPCWYLGDTACALFYTVSFIITSSSVGNMVLISVDRYVAICQPLHYSTKVTPRRAQCCVCLCWGAAVHYNCLILLEFLRHPGSYNHCQGECVLFINYVSSNVDLVFTLVGPITGIIILYVRVFVVAVGQAQAMRSNVATVVRARVTVGRSERKAARTLGVVVVVFLLCFCPYYCLTGIFLAGSAGNWLLYLNSCLNPVIYALLYPWFRKAVKLIITLQILRPNSSETNVL